MGGNHLRVPCGRTHSQGGHGTLSPGVGGTRRGLLVLLPRTGRLQLRVAFVPHRESPHGRPQQLVPRLAHGERHALPAQGRTSAP